MVAAVRQAGGSIPLSASLCAMFGRCSSNNAARSSSFIACVIRAAAVGCGISSRISASIIGSELLDLNDSIIAERSRIERHRRRHAPAAGRTVHGEPASAGHQFPAPDDAEVEAYLEQALHAPPPQRVESEAPEHPDTVVILDFGSQFAQLIARRVRELNVYSELLPHDTPMAELERRGARAVILSGGPSSVYDADAPRADPALWSGRIPVLGICYGLQLMAHELGGVLPSAKRSMARPRSR